jgi:hypothetical protein
MKKLSRTTIRMMLTGLTLLLVIALAFFVIQPLVSGHASTHSSELATSGQKAAMLGAHLLLLSDNTFNLYMPLMKR